MSAIDTFYLENKVAYLQKELLEKEEQIKERDKEISELKESKKKAATICAKWIWDNYEIAKDMSMVVLVEHLEKELEVSGKK